MAQFANNRNNGAQGHKAPSTPIAVGDFLVPTGMGTYIPYAASITVYFTGLTGTFVLGETVTQTISSATGIVLAQSTVGVTLGSITGTFDATHLLTGGTSGATATASALVTNNKIFGLSLTEVTSTDSDYADKTFIGISTPVKVLDFLYIPVSNGTATQLIEGSYVNVDPANPGSVNVATPGTQIYVYQVVDASNIIGAIALTV